MSDQQDHGDESLTDQIAATPIMPDSVVRQEDHPTIFVDASKPAYSINDCTCGINDQQQGAHHFLGCPGYVGPTDTPAIDKDADAVHQQELIDTFIKTQQNGGDLAPHLIDQILEQHAEAVSQGSGLDFAAAFLGKILGISK